MSIGGFPQAQARIMPWITSCWKVCLLRLTKPVSYNTVPVLFETRTGAEKHTNSFLCSCEHVDVQLRVVHYISGCAQHIGTTADVMLTCRGRGFGSQPSAVLHWVAESCLHIHLPLQRNTCNGVYTLCMIKWVPMTLNSASIALG